jgi:hypothetical protein
MLLIALMMEAARTSETLVNFYQTTLCYNPEDSNLHTHGRENLKSYLICLDVHLLQTNLATDVSLHRVRNIILFAFLRAENYFK